MKIRIVLLAIAAAAGVVLGMARLGNNPLLPGDELGIAISTPPPGDTIVVNHDSADMDAFVELALAPAGGVSFSAALDDGTALGVTAQRKQDGWFLRVHKTGGVSSSEKFPWPNGVPIRISRHSSPTAALRVVDWQVFSKDNKSDAAWKARRRSMWQWISLLLLLLSAAGAVQTTVESTEPARKAHNEQGRPCSNRVGG